MDSLRSKTTNWIDQYSNNVSEDYFLCVVRPIVDQDCFYVVQALNYEWSPGAPRWQTRVTKQFINGFATNVNVAFEQNPSIDFGDLIINSAGVGPFRTSNVYIATRNHIMMKLSPTGTLLASTRFAGPFGAAQIDDRYSEVAVDPSENVYFLLQVSNNAEYSSLSVHLVALNSSLGVRWSRMFPPTQAPSGSLAIFPRGISLDSANNVYVAYNGRNSTGPTLSQAGFIKYNSSGTELLSRAVRFDRPGTTASVETWSRVGVGTSQEIALFSHNRPSNDAYLTFYNSAGTIQWSRNLTYTDVATMPTSGWMLFAQDCVMDSANNIYLAIWGTGVDGGTGSVFYRCWLVKFNSSGTVQWQRNISNQTNNYIQPARRSAINLTGNDNLITLTLLLGFLDEYNNLKQPLILGLNADGSIRGTPPYSGGAGGSIGYTSSFPLTITSGTQPTIVTPTTASASTITLQTGAVITATPQSTGKNVVYMEAPPP
jgi:hypothetical protein